MIGNKIKSIAEKKKLDLNKLATKADIPYSSLIKMLDRDDYKISALRKIAEALGVELEDLVSHQPITVSQTISGKNNMQVGSVREGKVEYNSHIIDLEQCRELLKEKDRVIAAKDDIIKSKEELLDMYRNKANQE